MKNNFKLIIFYLFLSLIVSSNISSSQVINFNVSEVEITDNGDIMKGYNGGQVTTNNGVKIKAQTFEYIKSKSLLQASGGVNFKDENKNINIRADKVLYFKDEGKLNASGNVFVIDNNKKLNISANKILYFENKGEIIASGKVKINDLQTDLKINADEIAYFKNQEKIIATGKVKFFDTLKNIKIDSTKAIYSKKIGKISTEGITNAEIEGKYIFNSKNVTFLKKKMRLFSFNKSIIKDNKFSVFKLDEFDYQINKEFLKGKNVTIIENSNLPENEISKYHFENGFFDLKNNRFKTGETKITLKKNIFDRSENDPRLYGVSSNHEDGITVVNKAVFTSCSKSKGDGCPPWKLEANTITHDKNKRQIIYDSSILKVYDVPVFYFPKFFHPDPTVERQSGFLTPKLNNSNILGSSIGVPYFHVISDNKDYTFSPTIFSKNTQILQNEYRQENEHSSFIVDFGYTRGFNSEETNKNKNINHLFTEFKKDLNLNNFNRSDLKIFLERTNKDTFLKIFANSLSDSDIKPKNNDILKSGVDLSFENINYNIDGGIDIYEDLTKLNNDRYQFILPYYNFSNKPIYTDFGKINISSVGNNILDNTNNVKARIINDLSFNFNDKIFEKVGLKNNFNFYLKNLNSIGKNVDTYKSSPQIELNSLFEFSSELPLIKYSETFDQSLVPRLSLRINPSDMKNHSDDKRKINTNNIFNINRIGINDSFEAGNSLTLGLDYRKDNKNETNDYLEVKLASVLRDKEESNIPSQTTLNKKNSNLFGSINYNFSNNLNVDYKFSTDNKIEKFTYNSVGLGLTINNFVTDFNFIKEDSTLGNTNLFDIASSYQFNKNNSLSFKTRRNRELNLTEYYNLVYEYKNDCLTAGVRFNKTYYEDRDLKPTENLMFTVSFYPITTIEQSID